VIETPLLVTTGVAFLLAGLLQGPRFLKLRWEPNRHTVAAITAGFLPALFSTFCLLLSQDSFAYELVLFIGIFSFCGFLVPWAYVLFIEKSPVKALGIRREHWIRSLIISGVFALGPTYGILQVADFGTYRLSHVVGTALQLNVGGLFEVFLYCGFVHLRLRDAFGPVPAIVGAAAIYSLWHIGTELPMHADPVAALIMLFVIGLLCHALFATTYNLLVIWPIFFTAGAMNDFIVNLDLPEVVGASIAWSAVGWTLAVFIPAGLMWISKLRSRRNT